MTTSNRQLKVGDKVKFSSFALRHWYNDGNIWYKAHGIEDPIAWTGTIIQTNYYNSKAIGPNGRTFSLASSKFEALERGSAEDLILNKIKYLDKRFEERKKRK